MNPANVVTSFRILLSPVFVFLLARGNDEAALTVYLVVWASDGIDGFLARRFNYHSKLGSYLDPAADKIFLLSTYISMGYFGLLPMWLVWVVIIKDIITAVGTFVILPFVGAIEIHPLPEGKAATFFQLTTGFVALVAEREGLEGLVRFKLALVYITALLTLIAGIHYVIRGVQLLSQQQKGDQAHG